MKNIVMTAGVMILTLMAIVIIAKPDTPSGASDKQDDSTGALTLMEENNYDFGTISMAAGTVMHSFKVRNSGTETVEIGKIYTSCMCTTAILSVGTDQYGPFGMPGHGMMQRIGRKLEPGQEAVIEVTFDPAAHGPSGVGQISRTVIIENDSDDLRINFKAAVTP